MNFDEAMDAEVTKADACQEILRHSLDPKDFLTEVGDRDLYAGSDILVWLGY